MSLTVLRCRQLRNKAKLKVLDAKYKQNLRDKTFYDPTEQLSAKKDVDGQDETVRNCINAIDSVKVDLRSAENVRAKLRAGQLSGVGGRILSDLASPQAMRELMAQELRKISGRSAAEELARLTASYNMSRNKAVSVAPNREQASAEALADLQARSMEEERLRNQVPK